VSKGGLKVAGWDLRLRSRRGGAGFAVGACACFFASSVVNFDALSRRALAASGQLGVLVEMLGGPGGGGGGGDEEDAMGPPSFQFAPAQGMPSACLPVPMVSLSMLAQFCRDADGRASLRMLQPHTQQRLLTLLLEKTRAVVSSLAQGDELYGRNHAQCTELLVFALSHATALVASLPPIDLNATPVMKKTTSSKKAPSPPPPLGLVRCPSPDICVLPCASLPPQSTTVATGLRSGGVRGMPLSGGGAVRPGLGP
jgi:hypothetical protein